MRNKLIDLLGRLSRRPLALGTVLVTIREQQEVRPFRYEQVRPASAWSCVLSLVALLLVGAGTSSAPGSTPAVPEATVAAVPDEQVGHEPGCHGHATAERDGPARV